MVTKDYSKSRMRENRTYGSVRGGQSNLIPSTRLTAAMPLRVVVAASPQFFMPPAAAKAENHTTGPGARWKCTPSACGISPGGGDLLSPYLSADLSRSTHSEE